MTESRPSRWWLRGGAAILGGALVLAGALTGSAATAAPGASPPSSPPEAQAPPVRSSVPPPGPVPPTIAAPSPAADPAKTAAVLAAVTPPPLAAGASWLTTLNYYRAMAGLAPVADNPAWTASEVAHSSWMATNNRIGHDEIPGTPGYSTAGAVAARNSNVALAWYPYPEQPSAREWVEGWMTAPFHAAAMLDPRLRLSAYGAAQHASGRVAASLDVRRGRTGTTHQAPVLWPGPGTTVPLVSYDGGESPDPLPPCPGYTAPTGIPVVVLFPQTPIRARTTLTVDGQPVEHCAYDETTPAAAARGLSLYLRDPHALFVIPRRPLTPGKTYRVRISTTRWNLDWSFRAASAAAAPRSPSAAPGVRRATLSWSPPASDGGSPLTGYRIELKAAVHAGYFTPPTPEVRAVPATTRSVVIDGLADAAHYTASIRAVNAFGVGPAGTVEVESRPLDPAAPVYVTATPRDDSVSLRWTAPPDRWWAVSGYRVTAVVVGRSGYPSPPAVTAVTVPAERTTATLSGLRPGGRYRLSVAALYGAEAHPSAQETTMPLERSGPYWRGWDIARDVAAPRDGTGGYVLDGWGGLHRIGRASTRSAAPGRGTPYWRGWDIARGIDVLPDGTGGYVLDGWGGLHPFAIGDNPRPPKITGAPYWRGWDIARGVALLPDGTGGYVLDGWGGIHPFAIRDQPRPATPPAHPYWRGWDIARGLVLGTYGTGGLALDGWGGLHQWAAS